MSGIMPSAANTAGIDANGLETSIRSATQALLGFRKADGHWVFELEADCTIPAEYVLLRHYLAEPVDTVLEAKIAKYLRRIQGAHGGWPLVHDGEFDMSASVKAYFALKMIGDSVDAPHMVRAREAIHAHGGASKSNVFTRFLFALYGVTTWRATPVLPVEITLLPMWSPFHLNRISYWARTTLVPLLVLAALKPVAKNPKGIGIDELFLEDPRSVRMVSRAPHQSRGWYLLFSALDSVLRVIEPMFPKWLRTRAINAAVAFTEERLNGEDGMGAIFPPMANAVMMYEALGKGADYPPRATQRRGLDLLLVIKDDAAYCQPCVSPVWDTALTCHALLEAGSDEAVAPAKQGLDWLLPKQVLDVKGDWAVKAPNVRPGGWAFQYNNAHYPDLDDTAVVVMAMDRARRGVPNPAYDAAIARGREWIEGMQSRDGGWAAFDVNNLEYYLNNIPFSDHGALLDPPTEDVTARCISMLAQLGETAENPAVAAGIGYLRRTQLAEGSWYGRWGLNYVYGTWSVLCALNAAGVAHSDPMISKAADWLVSIQNADGGWGEDATSYRLDYKKFDGGFDGGPSTASQTAWALLGLMAAGEVENPAVARGVEYLMTTQTQKGLWDEQRYTATGFPRVFYLRYHGYSKFFPLWALARYRNLRKTNSRVVGVGM
jgi:squalene-hopene/tetraprenyl-beta-curcumene cyclase